MTGSTTEVHWSAEDPDLICIRISNLRYSMIGVVSVFLVVSVELICHAISAAVMHKCSNFD